MGVGALGFAVGVLAVSIAYLNLVSQTEEDNSTSLTSSKMDRNLRAFVLGGTGAVGKAIIHALAAAPQFTKVTLIGRRQVTLPTPTEDPRYDKFDEKIIDFDNLPEFADAFKGYDVGFWSLGTTKAKSGPEEYYKIDHDYVVNTAKLAKEGGLKDVHLVSAWGANKDSYFLYAKTKGQVEFELGEMGFERLSCYRPGQLLTKDRTEFRLGETISGGLARALDVFRLFSVDVPLLGQVIVANSLRPSDDKIQGIDHPAIIKLGKTLPNNKST